MPEGDDDAIEGGSDEDNKAGERTIPATMATAKLTLAQNTDQIGAGYHGGETTPTLTQASQLGQPLSSLRSAASTS